MKLLKIIGNYLILLVVLSTLPVFESGCTSRTGVGAAGWSNISRSPGFDSPATSTIHAKPLRASVPEGVDLKQYRIATIVPFAMEAGDRVDPLIGADFADDIYERLQNSFSGIFDEVRKGPVLATNGELVVTGTIRKYDPGSKGVRFFIGIAGYASFEADLTLKDAKNGQVLMTAPINKIWARGGITGSSKGIENMMVEAAAAAAATIADAKGWQAPPAR